MIRPGAKLIYWTGIIGLPFITLLSVTEKLQLYPTVLLFIYVIIVFFDFYKSKNKLDEVKVKAEKLIRLSENHPDTILITLDLKNSNKKYLNCIRAGLDFPSQIFVKSNDIYFTVDKNAEEDLYLIDWQVNPTKRGTCFINNCYLECKSSLGFWDIRAKRSINMQINIYPNLDRIRRSIPGLFLNKQNYGIHAERQTGKGREFERLREYMPGDGYDEIHWKATAKRNRPITKVYQIERSQEVYVIIDTSWLTMRALDSSEIDYSKTDLKSITNTNILDNFIKASIVIFLAAQKQNDHYGLITFDKKVNSFIRAKNGKQHYNSCRDTIFRLQPKQTTPDYDELFTFIKLQIRRRSLIFFLTCLDDPVLAEDFSDKVDLLSSNHILSVNMFKPIGAEPLFIKFADNYEDIISDLSGQIMLNNINEFSKLLSKKKVQFSLLEENKMGNQLVSTYSRIKQRQLL